LKALVLEEYNKLIYKDVADPQIGPDEVLVRVKSCGICGSDVHGMDGSTGRRIPPVIMGHEASGVIEQIGDAVTGWNVGDRVTFDSTIYDPNDWFSKRGDYNLSNGRHVLGVSCNDYTREGAFAEFVAIPQHILYKIPDNVSFDQAAMVEPAAVALHAIRLSRLAVGDTVVVIGAGIIGLFVIQILRSRGFEHIISIDVESEKIRFATELGASLALLNNNHREIIKEIKQLTAGRGADAVFEAVGLEETVQLAINVCRNGGMLTLIGNLTADMILPVQEIVTRQLRLQGSCAIAGEYPDVLDMIAADKLNVDSMLSARVPLSEGAEWFKRIYNKEHGLMKVILNP